MSTPSVIGNPQGGNDLAEVMKESVSKQDAATLAAAAKRLSDRASALQNDQSSPDNALIARPETQAPGSERYFRPGT